MMGESLIEGTAFEKKNLEVGESGSRMGIWRREYVQREYQVQRPWEESMCALLGKLGYQVWGMQSENESDGREVRDLTEN